MAQWFQTKVRYDKMQENGSVKSVTEPYLVDALSFTEAEARIIESRKPYISGDFTVTAVKKMNLSEIFFSEAGGYNYMAKVGFITIDDKKGVEKVKTAFMLVQGLDFDEALLRFKEGMKGTISDFELISLTRTPILDIFPAETGVPGAVTSES